MKNFEYISAKTFDAATAFLAADGRKGTLVKAGGVDVVDRLKERIAQPDRVLNLYPIGAGQKRIALDEKTMRIDALTTLAELAADAAILKHLPALATAAAEAASPQVRTVATLGGNLCQKPRCWYYRSQDFHCLKKGGGTCYAVNGDNRYHAILGAGACHIVHPSSAAVPLLAYGGSARLVSQKDGKPAERIVPLEEFFRVPANPQDDENVLAPGELIREILVPLSGGGPRSAFVEFREKQAFDWPLVMCAVNLNDRAQPRVVLGAVSPAPVRARNVEALLANAEISDGLLEKAAAAAREGAQPMSQNKYKVDLLGVVVQDALRLAAAGQK